MDEVNAKYRVYRGEEIEWFRWWEFEKGLDPSYMKPWDRERYYKHLQLREYVYEIYNLFPNGSIYDCSDHDKNIFSNIYAYLSKDEKKEFTSIVDTCFKKQRDLLEKDKNKKIDEAIKYLKENFRGNHQVAPAANSFFMAAKLARNYYVKFDKHQNPRYPDDRVEKDIETLINDKSFNNQRMVNKIKNNKREIIQLEKENVRFNKDISEFYEITSLEERKVYEPVVKYILKLKDERKRKIRSNNAKLNRLRSNPKFWKRENTQELQEKLVEQAKKNKAEEEKEAEEKRRLENELRIKSYELEKARYENGGLAKITELEQEVESLSQHYGLDAVKVTLEANEKYHYEKRMEQIKEDEKRKKKRNAELKEIAERALDEAAQELYAERNRSNWKFKPLDRSSEEFKRIKGELVHLANMTPEERTLQALQEGGAILPGATLETLTERERQLIANNINGFKDYSYSFVRPYKEYLENLPEDDIGRRM